MPSEESYLWGKGGALSNIGTYGKTHAAFRWETPERFNFGRDVVDAWPGDRPAMIWLGADGEERRPGFG